MAVFTSIIVIALKKLPNIAHRCHILFTAARDEPEATQMGGLRGVVQCMQRTAVQGTPDMPNAITRNWIKGAAQDSKPPHPLRRWFDNLNPGDTLHPKERQIIEEDIEQLVTFTGDTFCAHMDDAVAKRNPFFPAKSPMEASTIICSGTACRSIRRVSSGQYRIGSVEIF